MEDNYKKSPSKFDLRLIEFDNEEKIIREIRKHPFGQILIYLSGFFVVVLVLLAASAGATWLTSQNNSFGSTFPNAALLLVFFAVVISLVAIIIMFIAAFLYRSNIMLVTSDKIAQVLYRTIFDKKISQLSIHDVQDVTVTQKGFFAHLFNYGTIVIETAGEQQNYTFSYAPLPYNCAKDIMTAHEEYVKKYGN